MQRLDSDAMPSSEQLPHTLAHAFAPVPGRVFRLFPLPPETSSASFRALLQSICRPANVAVVEQPQRVDQSSPDSQDSRAVPGLASSSSFALKLSASLPKEAFVHFSAPETLEPLLRQLTPASDGGGGGGSQINLNGHILTVEASSWEEMVTAYLYRGLCPRTSKKAARPGVSNVLLVTMDDYGTHASSMPSTSAQTPIEKTWAPSIETFHFIFSAIGFVSKILLRRRRSEHDAHCALVQFANVSSAVAAFEQLNGQPVPEFLLPRGVGASPSKAAWASCTLRIAYSRHRNLVIHRQSEVCRDYVNTWLPLSEPLLSDARSKLPQLGSASDPPPAGPGGTVLLARIDKMVHRVTLDHIHHVFSNYGEVAKLILQERAGVTFALVQYYDAEKAATAKNTLQGHAIFDGGYCTLNIQFSHQQELAFQGNSETTRDYTTQSGAESDSTAGRRSQRQSAPEFEYVPVRGIDYVNAHETAARDYRGSGARVASGPGAQASRRSLGTTDANLTIGNLPGRQDPVEPMHALDSALPSLPGLGSQTEQFVQPKTMDPLISQSYNTAHQSYQFTQMPM